MAYQFQNQAQGKVIVTDMNQDQFTINGINTRQESADSIMAGLSTLLDIVDWTVEDAVRVVNQDIVESE